MSSSYTSSSTYRLHGGSGTLLLFTFTADCLGRVLKINVVIYMQLSETEGHG
jgi:hypothetical protein